LNQYADFKGRARRSEFWYFNLFTWILLVIPLFLLGGFTALMSSSGIDEGAGASFSIGLIVFLILAFGLVVPSLAVTARRLHDTGRSAWWYLISFIPLGSIVLLVFLCQDSNLGSNKWGPNPKDPNSDYKDHLI
jgi:uncharacterized membrane protein YhaH (DUF805 family)